MADAKQGGAGVFAKNVQKRFSRAQEKVLQKLGRTIETKDEMFEQCAYNFNKQQNEGNKLYKDLKAVFSAVKTMHESSKRLAETLHVIYRAEWDGYNDLKAIVENNDLLWNDYEEKLSDQAVHIMENYMSQFHEMKEKIAKRGRKLVDYDSARHHLEGLQNAKKKDEGKITKAEEEFNKAQMVFEDLNKELRDELPVLYSSRIGCYVSIFQNISNLRDVFYKEMSKLNHDLYEVMSKLEKQHSNKVFVIKGVKSKRNSLMISSPISCTNSFFMASVDPGTNISTVEKESLDQKCEDSSLSSISSETQDSTIDENSCMLSEEVAHDVLQALLDDVCEKQLEESENSEGTIQKNTMDSKENMVLGNKTESDSKESSEKVTCEDFPDTEEASQQLSTVPEENVSENILQEDTGLRRQSGTEDTTSRGSGHSSEMVTDEHAHVGSGDTTELDSEVTLDGDSGKRIKCCSNDVRTTENHSENKTEVHTEYPTAAELVYQKMGNSQYAAQRDSVDIIQDKTGDVTIEGLNNGTQETFSDHSKGDAVDITQNESEDRTQDNSRKGIQECSEDKVEGNSQDIRMQHSATEISSELKSISEDNESDRQTPNTCLPSATDEMIQHPEADGDILTGRRLNISGSEEQVITPQPSQTQSAEEQQM